MAASTESGMSGRPELFQMMGEVRRLRTENATRLPESLTRMIAERT